ncbi:MAG: Xaa-Pro peptidase family protein [Actinomycetota bacterium]|nr:Xaa-Pro peptidase family protein [Actinomycetota bacterium]
MSIAAPERSELPPLRAVGRADAVRDALGPLGCDALVVTELTNIRWLSGFSGSSATLVVSPTGLVLVTDGRYRDQASAELAAAGVDARIEITREIEAPVRAATAGWRVGLEAGSVTWSRQRTMGEWFDGEVVATDGLVEGLREVKDDAELARIARAAAICDDAVAEVAPMLLGQPSERDVAAELDYRMRLRGADDRAFDTIVASGPNGARPHAHPGDRRIVDGDLVVIDVGAMVDGYRSDMTRTFAIGEVDETRRRMLEVVTSAQAAAAALVAPGVATEDLDAAARDVIAAAGWADAFSHGLGHGVGLDIHEPPMLSATPGRALREGEVVTIEPGVYVPGVGGVRVEDTVAVVAGGSRTLTASTKDPSPSR